MTNSEILNRAADAIERRGWTKAGGWFPEDGGPVCAEGALKAAAREVHGIDWFDAHYDGAKPALRDYLGEFPFAWNDRQASAQPVIEALRACALIEAAKERGYETTDQPLPVEIPETSAA